MRLQLFSWCVSVLRCGNLDGPEYYDITSDLLGYSTWLLMVHVIEEGPSFGWLNLACMSGTGLL